jgi:hypothetical protein
VSSVKAEVTASTIANQIVLERRQATRSVLLVEGGTDARYFRRFVDRTQVSIEVCHDREKLVLVLGLLRTRGVNGALGIADRDFEDFLEGEQLNDADIIFWDFNDLESTIIPSIFIKILDEFGSQNKIDEFVETFEVDPFEKIIEEAAKIGTLRAISRIKSYNLRFQGMDFQFTTNQCFTLDLDATIDHICSRSSKMHLKDEIQGEFERLKGSCLDLKTLCQGHDLVRIIGRSLRGRLGSTSEFDKNDKIKNPLYPIIRISHELAEFCSTSLYKRMKSWESNNHPWKVLS